MSRLSRAHVHVSGMVQGVWFRASTIDAAMEIGGLTGWVRNMPDGRVEVVAEGERAAVDKLIAWLHHGPKMASVKDVIIDWSEGTGEFAEFGMER